MQVIAHNRADVNGVGVRYALLARGSLYWRAGRMLQVCSQWCMMCGHVFCALALAFHIDVFDAVCACSLAVCECVRACGQRHELERGLAGERVQGC